MANPYGIEQVDVPGILGAYDAARQRRVQMMLQQTQLEREQNQLDRETKLHTAFSKFVVPGAGMSGAASSYGTPAPSAASPAPTMDPASPTAALASETTPAPAAAPSSAIPAPATDQRHPMASWMEANTPAIQDAMRADPQVGMQMIQNFSSLDAAAQQRVKAHLELADELNEHAIRHLATVHDQASWDAARTAYSAELQHYGAPVPDLPPTYDEKFVQGLRMSTLSTKEQLDAAKGVVMGEGSTLNNPYTGEQIANNPKPKHYTTFEVHNADGTTTPYGFDPETHQTFALSADGTPATGGAAPGGAPGGVQRTHGYTPRASNGGDNPDNVVDNKIAALSHAVGVDPDTPMTSSQFVKFVQAIPATEGSGNNNPGGIKDGAYARSQPGYAGAAGQYAKFTTPEAGTAAMAQLLRRNYYDKGQTSIRDIIEGKPVGGAGHAAAAAPAAGGAQITGRPLSPDAGDDDTAKFIGGQVALGQPMPPLGMGKEAAAMRRAILAEATKQWKAMGISPGEANVIAAQNKSGLVELGRIATIKANVQTAENTANLNATQVLSLLGSAGTTGSPIFNAWQQAGRRATGNAKVSAFDLAVKTLATEYARVMSGGGTSPLSDSARHEADALIHTSMTPDQFRSTISQMKIDMANRSAGIEQERQATLSQIRTGGRGAPSTPAPPAPSSIPTLTVEQARAAPKGTVFRTTDGRTMRKQ